MSGRSEPWLRHRLEAWALSGALAWGRQGDLSAALGRARTWGRVGRRVLRREWAWCQRNLELVFGSGLDPNAGRALATLAFEHHFMSHLEGARAGEVRVRVQTSGLDAVAEAHAAGRGVLVCSVHLGSWEPGLKHLTASGLPVAAVFRPADNPLSERAFAAARSAYGVEWISKHDLAGAARALRRGKVLALMTDVNTRKGGTTAEFLGIPAQCPAGPARLALRFGCPIIPSVALRERPGEARIVIGAAIRPEESAGAADPVASLTRRINAVFEPWVLEHAEQYNWLHPRWRSRPDGSTWRPSDPLATQWAERTASFPPLPERVRALLARGVS